MKFHAKFQLNGGIEIELQLTIDLKNKTLFVACNTNWIVKQKVTYNGRTNAFLKQKVVLNAKTISIIKQKVVGFKNRKNQFNSKTKVALKRKNNLKHSFKTPKHIQF